MEIQDRRNELWSEIRDRFDTKRKNECLLVLKEDRRDRGKFVVLSIKERRFDDVETRGVFWDADLALAFCTEILSNRAIDGKNSVCEWIDKEDYWQTQCGDDFVFTVGGPLENNFKYCPYCGGKIILSNDKPNPRG